MIRVIQIVVNTLLGYSSKVRVFFYSRFFPIGKETIILGGFNVRNPQKIVIGSGCYININCFIQGSGGVAIGNDVIIAPNVSIYSENHKYSDRRKKIKDQGFEREKVVIEDNVWIAANAIILPGVIIGRGSVVAAGAVVTKSLGRNVIIAGVPAKIIKKR